MEAIEGRSREGQRRAAMAGAQVAGGGPKAVDFGLGGLRLFTSNRTGRFEYTCRHAGPGPPI